MITELPDDIEELLVELNRTDGLTSGIQIHDPQLGAYLVARRLVTKNHKGHYYGTALLAYMLATDEGVQTAMNHIKLESPL